MRLSLTPQSYSNAGLPHATPLTSDLRGISEWLGFCDKIVKAASQHSNDETDATNPRFVYMKLREQEQRTGLPTGHYPCHQGEGTC